MSEEDLQLLPLEPPVTRCPNCNSKLQGQFCFSCGQNQKSPDRFFLSILHESFEDVFNIDSRAARTVFNLLFRPGYLTIQYFAGRRARYVQPLRLYLITSILFFFFLSLLSALNLNVDAVAIIGDSENDKEDPTQWQSEFDSSLDKFDIGFLTPEQNEALVIAVRTQTKKAILIYTNDPGQLADQFLELVPQIMFFLLPLFAVVMKILYFGSGRYYTEHLILAVHNHCFLFIALLLTELGELFSTSSIAIVTNSLSTIIEIWIPIYMYWGLRVVYLEGHLLSALKYLLLIFSYFSLFIAGLSLTFMWSVMML